ncbi:hypothetical protein CesoFtcFv8_008984 [Champsocephalus esox]|uniref:Uncharacterized protein n=1 Tax=Champsocephalus esox TaxID=159716 RepID=A0AAN8CCJ5_9TELE|nr:hypothetical protein CesoFtcFv8_008984 [Champsocephalus esox]
MKHGNAFACPPQARSISSGSGCWLTADWAGQCRARAADRHPPAVYGSGAAVAEVHPRGTCCTKKPSSRPGRSCRPWRDFLQGCLTFCLGMAAAGWSFGQCKVDLCAGLSVHKARKGQESFCCVTHSLS